MEAKLAGVSLGNLSFDFLKGKKTSINPSFSLSEKGMSAFDWINICLSIR